MEVQATEEKQGPKKTIRTGALVVGSVACALLGYGHYFVGNLNEAFHYWVTGLLFACFLGL